MKDKKEINLKGIALKTLIYDVGTKIGTNTAEIKDLKIHFTNHLHSHRTDKILQAIYTLIIIGCFSYLKWGT